MYQGQSIGLWVDTQDHVWIVHRPDVLDAVEGAADQKTGECCKMAPPILEFDPSGTLLRRWGGERRTGLHVADVEPRPQHRQQGQSSGSAATAARTTATS